MKELLILIIFYIIFNNYIIYVLSDYHTTDYSVNHDSQNLNVKITCENIKYCKKYIRPKNTYKNRHNSSNINLSSYKVSKSSIYLDIENNTINFKLKKINKDEENISVKIKVYKEIFRITIDDENTNNNKKRFRLNKEDDLFNQSLEIDINNNVDIVKNNKSLFIEYINYSDNIHNIKNTGIKHLAKQCINYSYYINNFSLFTKKFNLYVSKNKNQKCIYLINLFNYFFQINQQCYIDYREFLLYSDFSSNSFNKYNNNFSSNCNLKRKYIHNIIRNNYSKHINNKLLGHNEVQELNEYNLNYFIENKKVLKIKNKLYELNYINNKYYEINFDSNFLYTGKFINILDISYFDILNNININTTNSVYKDYTNKHLLIVNFKPFKMLYFINNQIQTIVNENQYLLLDNNANSKKNPNIDYKFKQSIRLDATIINSEYIYGLPERNGHYILYDSVDIKNVYRFYNYDHFKFPYNHYRNLYGYFPVIFSKSNYKSLSNQNNSFIIWNNYSETFVDIKSNENQSYVNSDLDGLNIVNTKTITYLSEAGIIDISLSASKTVNKLYSNYQMYIGTLKLPPYWSLGYHHCRWNFEDNKDILDIDSNFDHYDIPYDSIWYDIDHTDKKKYFTWGNIFKKDIHSTINYIKNKDRKVVVIIDPHIKKEEKGMNLVADIFKQKNLFIKYMYLDSNNKQNSSDIKDYVANCWPGKSYYINYFDIEARCIWEKLIEDKDNILGYFNYKNTFYKNTEKKEDNTDYCVDVYYSNSNINNRNKEYNNDNIYIWNDMNEPSVFDKLETTMDKTALFYYHIKNNNITHSYNKKKLSRYNKSNYYQFREGKNLYGSMMFISSWKGVLNKYSYKRPFVLSRSFYLNAQAYSAIWTGDTIASFNDLGNSVIMIIQLSISGYSFVGSDIGGFALDCDKYLHLRWLQLGVYYPFMRGHSNNESNRREFWLYSNDTIKIFKDNIKLRYKLLPYIYTSMYNHHLKSDPLIKPLWMLDSYHIGYKSFTSIYSKTEDNNFNYHENTETDLNITENAYISNYLDKNYYIFDMWMYTANSKHKLDSNKNNIINAIFNSKLLNHYSNSNKNKMFNYKLNTNNSFNILNNNIESFIINCTANTNKYCLSYIFDIIINNNSKSIVEILITFNKKFFEIISSNIHVNKYIKNLSQILFKDFIFINNLLNPVNFEIRIIIKHSYYLLLKNGIKNSFEFNLDDLNNVNNNLDNDIDTKFMYLINNKLNNYTGNNQKSSYLNNSFELKEYQFLLGDSILIRPILNMFESSNPT